MGAVFVLMLAAAMGLGVLAAYVRSNPQAARVPDTMRRADPTDAGTHVKRTKSRSNDSGSEDTTVPETLMIGIPRDGSVALEPIQATLPEGTDKLVFVGNQVFKAFGKDGARVLRVDVVDGLATVQCNPKIIGFGSIEEGQFLKSIAMTFGQFDEINKVEFMIEGQKVDTLGNVEISDGIKVIRASDSAAAKGPQPNL